MRQKNLNFEDHNSRMRFEWNSSLRTSLYLGRSLLFVKGVSQGKTQTTKDPQFKIIRWTFEEKFHRRYRTQFRSRHSINKICHYFKCIRPRKGERSMVKKALSSFNQMSMFMFCESIMFRYIWEGGWAVELSNALNFKKIM